MPWLSFDRAVETADGPQFMFTSVGAVVFIPVLLVATLTFAFASKSAIPLLLGFLIPLCFIKIVWTFRSAGPAMEKRLTLFGRTLVRRTLQLQQGDAAYVEPIEDSVFLTVRPRWYTLTVWSTVLSKEWVVMKSNRLEELERTACLFNAAIQKALTWSSHDKGRPQTP